MLKSTSTVMIVDGQRLTLDLLAKLLRSFGGFDVAGEFTDALSFAAEANREVPDMAIVDAGLATMAHTTLSLTARHPSIRVVFLDRRFRVFQVKRAFESGAIAYLTKQDTLTDFEASLRRIAAGQGGGVRSTIADRDKRCPMNPGLLTDREVDALTHLAAGMTVRVSAEMLGLSPNTVENHRANIMKKLQLHKSADLVRYAIREGLIEE